jgi:chitodextrinase
MIPLLVVVALVAGLVVWSPWIAPAAPAKLGGTSQSATSALVTWERSNGHTGAGHYSILRDGATVATVSSDQMSYLDQGLRPGQSYTYSVVAESWLRHSAPSPNATIRVLAPSPAQPTRGEVRTNSATVRWSPPAKSPTPDSYEILRDGSIVNTVKNTSTVYQDTGLTPATSYHYQVVARWGENRSSPSAALTLKTVTPPLSAARLAGSSVPVKFVITNVSSITNLSSGVRWTDYWDLAPRCSAGACGVQLTGNLTPPTFRTVTFKVGLARQGTVYSGTTTVHLTKCGTISVTDTLTVRIAVRSAGPEGTEWVARSWAGTVTVVSPFVDAGGGFFCPGSRIDSNVAG